MIITRGFITGNMCTHGFGAAGESRIYSECIFMSMSFSSLSMSFGLGDLNSSATIITDTQYINSSGSISSMNFTTTFKKLGVTIGFKCG